VACLTLLGFRIGLFDIDIICVGVVIVGVVGREVLWAVCRVGRRVGPIAVLWPLLVAMHMGRMVMSMLLTSIPFRRSVITTFVASVIISRRVRFTRRIVSIAPTVARWGAIRFLAVWGFAVWLAWLGLSCMASLWMATMGTLWQVPIPPACLIAIARWVSIWVLILAIIIAHWLIIAPLVAWMCFIPRCCVGRWVGWVAAPILRVAVVCAPPLPTSLSWRKSLQPSACI
jgi:hypothetical protein